MIRTGKHGYAARAARATSTRRPDAGADDAGFTLIEAVVSLTIFVIVTIAAVTAIVTGIKSSNANRDRTVAANVAQQALADAQAAPATSLAAAPTATTTTTVGNEPYTVERRITIGSSPSATATPSACPSSIAAGTAYWLHVSVRVTWRGGPSSGVAMDTVRTC